MARRDAIIELVELFMVALYGGHNLALATGEVAVWSTGLAHDAMERCEAELRCGADLDEALSELVVTLGPRARPLFEVLAAHLRHGVPVIEPLARLVEATRVERRRDAQVAARRLPVVLTFPVVICVLPAFVLLTIVPLVADTLSSFDW